jgi:hypothetical protein
MPCPTEVTVQPCEAMVKETAERALALLARWATRRAQRIAKERSRAVGACRNRQINKQLGPHDGEEQT